MKTRLHIDDGTIEAMKWLGLLLMTMDHLNRYLFSLRYQAVFDMGRIAMPLFAFVLAYNLARPGALARGTHFRAMRQLLLWGVVATAFYIPLGASVGGLFFGWYPLNILFMLLSAAAVIYLIEAGGYLRWFVAFLAFVFGGLFAEFWWIGVAFCVISWWYCRTSSRWAALLGIATLVSLVFVNVSLSALAVIPILAAAPFIALSVPRIKGLFYIYYPAHLAVLLLIIRIHGGGF